MRTQPKAIEDHQLWRFLLQLPLAWDLNESEEEREGGEAVSLALHPKLLRRRVCGTLPASIRVLRPRLVTWRPQHPLPVAPRVASASMLLLSLYGICHLVSLYLPPPPPPATTFLPRVPQGLPRPATSPEAFSFSLHCLLLRALISALPPITTFQ